MCPTTSRHLESSAFQSRKNQNGSFSQDYILKNKKIKKGFVSQLPRSVSVQCKRRTWLRFLIATSLISDFGVFSLEISAISLKI